MKRTALAIFCAGLIGATASHTTFARDLDDRDGQRWQDRADRDDDDDDDDDRKGRRDWSFQRVGTFANYKNASIGETTVSEIVAATADGKTLIYTDADRGTVGFIDITNPAAPAAGGTVVLDPDPTDDVDYSPTSVDVLRNQYALVSADTSASKKNASGELLVIDVATWATVARIDLGGQPDSLKVSPDHRFIAIAIENERDETLCVGGLQNDRQVVGSNPGAGQTTAALCTAGGGAVGVMPQNQLGNPAGYLAVVGTAGAPASWVRRDVDLTGVADLFPDDPEPEFVDVNQRNQAVVTMQENNHIVIVDLPSRTVVAEFPAGSVDLTQIDTVRAGSGVPNTIALVNSVSGRRREPDSVAWVGQQIATANEGDLVGGSRGFSIFNMDGSVAFDSGNTLEHLAVRFGHYPDRRSNAKGNEPESIAAAKFGPNNMLFIGSERGSFVAVYSLDKNGRPEFSQLLPAPLAPEGLLAIPHRNLLIASGENDTPPYGVRSSVMIYQLKPGAPTYPQVASVNDTAGTPIPWSALSGMTEIPGEFGKVQAVWDSFYTPTRVFTIDVSSKPAVITNALTVARPSTSPFYDPEGLAYAPDGSLWIASEGNLNDSRPNRLIKVDPTTGTVLDEVGLPVDVLACRAAERAKAASSTPPPPNGTGTLGSGFEGLDILPTGNGTYQIFVAQQRGWNYTTSDACAQLDDDPTDAGVGGGSAAEPTWTRIWVFDPQTGSWNRVPYELAPKPANAAWVGLSEITLVDDGWVVIERDNLTGDFGVFKTLAHLPLTPGTDGAFTRDEKAVYDLRPRLTANSGWITDKPEGVAVLPDGRLFVVTDNDGVDGWSGETWFLRLGPYWQLFE